MFNCFVEIMEKQMTRKLALRQQFNANYVPKTKYPVDGKMMHHVRSHVSHPRTPSLQG